MHMIDKRLKFLIGFVLLEFLIWTVTKDNNCFLHGRIQNNMEMNDQALHVFLVMHFRLWKENVLKFDLLISLF